MKLRFAVVVLSSVIACISLAGAARAFPVILPRAGQVGVGMEGQFGGFLKSGNLGKEFDNGGVLDVHLVYRMRYERAMGLTFEQLNYGSRHVTADSSGAFPAPLPAFDPVYRKSLNITTEGFDLYQFFRTRTRTPMYLKAGLGIAQVAAKTPDGGTIYPLQPDGYYLSAGAGLERFVYRSWALTASARYMGVFLDGSANTDLHAALGVILYAAY
jgi:hypothetical protein